MDYQALLEYATTDIQRESLNVLHTSKSQSAAAKTLNIDLRVLTKRLASIKRKAAKMGWSPEHGMTRTAPEGFKIKGVSTLQDGQWVKIVEDNEQEDRTVDAIVEALSIKQFKPVKLPKQLNSDLMNVYVFGDSHIDALSWFPETGADWDLDIAIHHHMSAMTDLVSRSPKADVGILATMGDLFHRDGLKAETTKGTEVDVDGRLGRSWDMGVEMIRAMIDTMLKKYQTVQYICVRGNHSATLELVLSRTIRIAYENEPRVEVLDNTAKQIPVSFGENFLLFVHGDRLNTQRKADIVTSRYRKEHGSAKFSHVLSGHLHHADSKELSGVLVEIFPVLPTPDAWHCEGGFMTSDQAATVVTYSRLGGIIGRTITNPRIFLQKK